MQLDWNKIVNGLSREDDEGVFAGLFMNSEDYIDTFNDSGEWTESETVMDSESADCVGEEDMVP